MGWYGDTVVHSTRDALKFFSERADINIWLLCSMNLWEHFFFFFFFFLLEDLQSFHYIVKTEFYILWLLTRLTVDYIGTYATIKILAWKFSNYQASVFRNFLFINTHIFRYWAYGESYAKFSSYRIEYFSFMSSVVFTEKKKIRALIQITADMKTYACFNYLISSSLLLNSCEQTASFSRSLERKSIIIRGPPLVKFGQQQQC